MTEFTGCPIALDSYLIHEIFFDGNHKLHGNDFDQLDYICLKVMKLFLEWKFIWFRIKKVENLRF